MVATVICLSLSQRAYCYEIALEDVNSDRAFHEGLAVAGSYGKYGYIDASGRNVIPQQFKEASDFVGGMAVVETETGFGIINRQSYFLLKPIYKSIERDEEKSPLFFIVEDKNGKKGGFYNNRLVLPVIYEDVDDYNYPFIEYDGAFLNLVTGEKDLDFPHEEMGIVKIRKLEDGFSRKDDNCQYYDKDGYRIDLDKLSKSSRGLVVFTDSVKDEKGNIDYVKGLKNCKTGEIVVPAKYRFPNHIWIADHIQHWGVFENGKWDNNKSGLFDANGIEVLSADENNYIGNYRITANGCVIAEGLLFGLYTLQGKELLPLQYNSIWEICPGWFHVEHDSEKYVFCAKTERLYKGDGYFCYDGMINICNEGYRSFINTETGKVFGEYKDADNFHEGVSIVTNKNGNIYDDLIIDKSGNVLLVGNEKFQIRRGSSEGVIPVKINGKNYYVYNPLGHGDYVYNQEVFSDETINRWWTIAEKAFNEGNYDKAKEYYYRIMMDNPYDVNAIISYGASIHNLGQYEEAIKMYEIALEISPDEETAKSNLEIAYKDRSKVQQQQLPNDGSSSSTRMALESFGNMLMQISNTLQSGSNGGYSGYTGENPYLESYSLSSSSRSSGKSTTYYQSQYNRWANLARRHYNSLTTTGYRAKSKNENRSGGTLTGMSSSNYTFQKKSLREAQREMRKIREEARKNGITIQQSTWETATVSY